MNNDYELLYMAGEDKELVEQLLYKKYKNLIYWKARKYSSSSIFFEDYLNEAILAFYEAVDNYQDKYKFITYLNTCIDRNLLNLRKALNRKRYKTLNESIGIEDVDITKTIIEVEDKNNPEKLLIEESNYNELKNKIINNLTWEEELVFLLKEQNYTNKEISEVTDNKLKTVYNIINRIQRKMSKIVSN